MRIEIDLSFVLVSWLEYTLYGHYIQFTYLCERNNKPDVFKHIKYYEILGLGNIRVSAGGEGFWLGGTTLYKG